MGHLNLFHICAYVCLFHQFFKKLLLNFRNSRDISKKHKNWNPTSTYSSIKFWILVLIFSIGFLKKYILAAIHFCQQKDICADIKMSAKHGGILKVASTFFALTSSPIKSWRIEELAKYLVRFWMALISILTGSDFCFNGSA